MCYLKLEMKIVAWCCAERFGERFTQAKHFYPITVQSQSPPPGVLRRVSGRPEVVKSASTMDGLVGCVD